MRLVCVYDQRTEVEFHLRRLLQQSREPSVELLVDAIAKNEGKSMHMPQNDVAAHSSESDEWLTCKLNDIVLVWCQSVFREQRERGEQPTSTKVVWLAVVDGILSSNTIRVVRLDKVILLTIQ